MQDVIHRVMEAENEAKKILQHAREEGERIISVARQKAKTEEEKVRNEVRETARRLIENARLAAEKEKAAKLERATQEVLESVQIDEVKRERLVEAVVNFVAGCHSSG